MPRSFDLSAEYPAGIARVHATFSDEQYWLARLADSGADAATLNSMTAGADGSIEVATTQVLYRERLPALVAQFHRGDLEVVRNERWSPIRDGKAHAQVAGNVPGSPASLSGDAVLTSTAAGSRLAFTAHVYVDVPLVGGKIEGFIGAKLAELITAEQRFTSVWVAQNR